MSGIDSNIKVNKQLQDYISCSTTARVEAATPQVVPMVTAKSTKGNQVIIDYVQKLAELAKANGLNIEKLLAELEETNPDIRTLSLKEQYQIASQKYNLEAAQPVVTSEKTNKKVKEEKPVSYKEFETLSREQKVDVLFEELAKNEFLYGDENNKRELKYWNSLSDEQKQQLITNVKAKAQKEIKIKNNGKFASATDFEKYVSDIFGADAIDNNLEKGLIYLRTATSNLKNIKTFMQQDKADRLDQVVYEITINTNDEDYTTEMKAFYEENTELSNAIKYFQEGYINTQANLSPSEIKNALEKSGKNPLEVQIDYLKARKAQGFEIGEEKLKDLQQRNETVNIVKNHEPKDSSVIDGFKQSDNYKKSNFETLPSDAKATVVTNFVKQNFSNLKPEEFTQKVRDLMVSIAKEDPALLAMIAKKIYKNANNEQKAALASMKDAAAQAINAGNTNNMSEEHAVISAQTQETMYSEAETPEQKVEIGKIQILEINTADAVHTAAVSSVTAGSQNKELQRATADKGFEIKNNPNAQNVILTNVANLSDLDIRKETGLRLPETHKNNQVDLTHKFIADREVANAMNEAQILNKFNKENQTQILKSFKNRFEQDDYSKDEAVKQLNTLSDQIQNCDKDNQLDMHNEMMSSKFSEVQEHTAGNIGKYDPSVQADALNTVYQTGNQKAIQNAQKSISNLGYDEKTNPSAINDIMQDEYKRAAIEQLIQEGKFEFSNQAIEEKISLREKIAGGHKLTSDELRSLSPAERKTYVINYFKKLPIQDKIKLLGQMHDGTMKKIVYTTIARSDSTLFNEICDDKNRADALLSMGLPIDVQNKIAEYVKFKAIADENFREVAGNNELYTQNPITSQVEQNLLKKDSRFEMYS